MKNKYIMKRITALLICIMLCVTCFQIPRVKANSGSDGTLTKLTLSQLGIADGTYSNITTVASGVYEKGFADTLVSFYATSKGDAVPRIHFGATEAQGRDGINILLYGEALVVGNDGVDPSNANILEYTRTEVLSSSFDLTSFLEQKILYQLKTEFLALDADGEKNDIHFTLYINKKEAVSVDIKNQTSKLGNYIFFVDGEHNLESYIEETTHTLVESNYTCYTMFDAGMSDGVGEGYGRLLDSEGVDITGSNYDKVLFGASIMFKTVYARIHYAAPIGVIYDGICIYLQEDGTLALAKDHAGLDYESMVIEPKQFGFESFANQQFKLQLTTDVVAKDDDESNDIRLGIWINGKLANNTYCYVLNQLDKIGSFINFSDGVDTGRYSLWDIEAPTGKMENCVEITEDSSYLVEADTLVNKDSDKRYVNGDIVTVAGDYKASYGARDIFTAGEKTVVLWKHYDTHADSEYDVRDLVATKKAGRGIRLQTKAGQMAAAKLKDGSACEIIRQYLIDEITSLPTTSPYYYQMDENGKVMPIIGWYAPVALTDFTVDAGGEFTTNYRPYKVETDFLQDKYYEMITDLGINVLAYQEKNYAEYNEMQILKGLSLAEKYGINFFVMDSGIEDGETDEKVLANRMNAYSRYSSFAGVLVADEPKTAYYNNLLEDHKYISDIKNKASLLNKYGNLMGYINLSSSNEYNTYDQYVQEYISACKPKYISFDHYVFADGGNMQFYFQSLKAIRDRALENNISFGGCVGTTTTNYGMTPNSATNALTKGKIDWKVNTLLAYGAKGYTWFTVIQPYFFAQVGDENGLTGMDADREGLIGVDGSKTSIYGDAKAINQWVGRIDSILMDAKNLAVLSDGEAKNTTGFETNTYENMTISAEEGNSYGAIAGVFDYKGQTAYYVVNMDYESEQKVTLSFDTACDLTIYEVTSEDVAEVSSTTEQQLTLAAGAAALVIAK